MGIPLTHRRPHVTGQRVAYAPAGAETGGAATDTIPRPAPHLRNYVDMNTGSLGQGMSLATGLALAAKHAKADYKVYAVVGDGECQEGIVWEAAMAAAHYKLDNLCVLLDYNGLQIDGTNDQVMGLGNIVEKFKAFGFECFEVDGHNIEEIDKAIEAPVSGKPKFICCHTIKGKGVSFMENQVGWHGRPLKPEEFETAMKELEA